MTTIPLRQALERSDSCFVALIRERIAAGRPPLARAELVDGARPPVVRVAWPEGEPFAALFLPLDRRPEVRS